MNGCSQQINGREGETAILFGCCPLNFSLRVAGFAPRHLNLVRLLLLIIARYECVGSRKMHLS